MLIATEKILIPVQFILKFKNLECMLLVMKEKGEPFLKPFPTTCLQWKLPLGREDSLLKSNSMMMNRSLEHGFCQRLLSGKEWWAFAWQNACYLWHMADYEAPDMRKPITRETTIGYPPVIGLVGLSSFLMWWFPKLLLHKWRPSSAGLLCALDPQARLVLHGHLSMGTFWPCVIFHFLISFRFWK